MNLEFVGQNVHFAVNLLAALSFFAVFWLTFDAWLERKKPVETVKWAGFLLVAFGLLLNGAVVEQTQLGSSFLGTKLPIFAEVLRALGYILLILGQLLDPLMKRPKSETYSEVGADVTNNSKNKAFAAMPAAAGTSSVIKLIFMPLLPLLMAGLYLRRSTTGLERHLRPLALGFGLLSLFELFSAIGEWHTTTNPILYTWVSNYGPVWWLAQASLLAAGVIFGKWVWQYLTKRLMSQLFIVLLSATVAIYFVSTAGFSLLLLGNTKSQALSELTTANSVLNYAVQGRKAELRAQAESALARPGLYAAVVAGDHNAVVSAVGNFAAQHKLSSLIVTDADGKVLLRSDDTTRWSDSLSQNSLVQRALIGREASSVTSTKGVIAPNVALVTALPIRSVDNLIVGTVIASTAVSNSFVDGIKASTGLDSTVYGGGQRSATTLLAADGVHRASGIQEANKKVLDTVLKQGKTFSGETTYQNRIYLAAYAPLKDVDNNTIGMLLVAQPSSRLLADAAKSIQQAFLVTVMLLILSIAPVYMIAKKISNGVR